MKKAILVILAMTSFSALASETVIKCVDGARSMTITELASGKLKGKFVGFDDELTNMVCKPIENTKNYRCDQDDYYVVAFYNNEDELTVQLNLQGDFGADSGYLYSLKCE